MTIAASAPRGGIIGEFAGSSRTFLLTNAEIEKFEDAHGSVFEVIDGFTGAGKKPTSRMVRDIVALALVGGGMKPADADKLVEDLPPSQNSAMYGVALAALVAAFKPDAVGPGGGDEQKGRAGKKTQAAGASAE